MATEDVSIFKEIEEELKEDATYAFLKKHAKAIGAGLAVVAMCILAYASWHSRRNQRMESITTALVNILRTPALNKHDMELEGMSQDAPAELKPILSIMKHGRKLSNAQETFKHAEELLAFAQKAGVDLVWRDLAMIIYTSYKLDSSEKLIASLMQLTAEDRPFRLSAIEMIASIYEEEGNIERACEYLKQIVDDVSAPDTMKARISRQLNYLKNVKIENKSEKNKSEN